MRGDSKYAALILKDSSNSDDPGLVQIVVTPMDQAVMIKASAVETKSKEANDRDHYVGRLR